MNHAGGVSPDGKYIAVVSGWDLNGEKEGAVLKPYGKTLAPVPSVSSDGGRTWKQFPAVPAPSGTGGFGLIPFGRILPLPDGELGAMFYSFGTFFFTSADGGATWKQRGALAELPATYKASKHNETCWLILRNGDLYAATRTAAWERLEAFRSKDMGRTWKSEGFITFAGQAPADLTQLPDDRVLLTYTIRNPGQWGVGARLADAAAANWGEPVRIVDLDGPGTGRDVGYPSSVVLADNVIVTAYYSRAITTHYRYHMGIVRWKPPLPKGKASTEKKAAE